VPAGRRRTAFRFSSEQDRDARKDQHDANHRKGVAETRHQRVPLDGVAERNDRLLMCGRRIAHAVRQEEVGHLIDPGADFLAAKVRNRLESCFLCRHESALAFGIYRQWRYRDQRCDSA